MLLRAGCVTLVWVDRLLRDGWCGYWEQTTLAFSLGATDQFVLLTVSGQVRDRCNSCSQEYSPLSTLNIVKFITGVL